MTTDCQDNFKTLKDKLKKGIKDYRLDFAPDPSRLYDGKIDRGTQRIKIYAKDFICSRCTGSSCFYCPDCSGEYFLACTNDRCMWDEAEHNKKPARLAFKKMLETYRSI